MAKMNQFVIFLSLSFLSFLTSAAFSGSKFFADAQVSTEPAPRPPVAVPTVPSERTEPVYTWCIAKPSVDEQVLEGIIRYCCDEIGVDCSVIQENGSCFHPNNAVAHASVVMNLYYISAGKNTWNCDFQGMGLTIYQNPSYGSCVYPM